MQVFRHLPQQLSNQLSNQPCEPLTLAIGNFDGMHLGHQALLKANIHAASSLGKTPAVLTFEPHPREFFTPHNAPARLTTLREKLELFEAAGIQKVFICAFNKRFAAISADAFLNILRQQLNANTVLVGHDFKFGAKRLGDIDSFKNAGFDLIALPQVDLDGSRVSSTRVRDALAAGDFTLATQLLGRHYSISGKVVHGAKRGRELGFPTANIHMRHERPALTGVYAVKLSVGKLQGLNAIANLGVRPTFKHGIAGVPKLLLETHVIDFNGDLYGQHVHVEFLHKIRVEQKFESLDALKTQIAQDIKVAKDYFNSVIPAQAGI